MAKEVQRCHNEVFHSSARVRTLTTTQRSLDDLVTDYLVVPEDVDEALKMFPTISGLH